MLDLDLRTIILLLGGMTLLVAVVFAFMRRNFPTSIRGPGLWSVGLGLLFPATLLFGARGAIPDLLSVVVANVLTLVGYSTLYFGSQRFFGRSPSVRIWGGLTFIAALVLTWFTIVEPNFGVRLLLMTFLLFAISILHGLLIVRRARPGFPRALTAAALWLEGATQAVRFIDGLGASANDGMFDRSPIQSFFISVYAVTILLIGVGLLLLATERLLEDYRQLSAEHVERGVALARKASRLEELGALRIQFVADIAHELRTPLTLVLGPLDDLADHMVHCGDAPQRALERVRRNAERLRELVEQLLDVARLDSGGVRLRARRGDLAAFLRRCADRFQVEAVRRGLTFEVKADPMGEELFFDPDLLDKVLSNLVGNAMKFTPAGGRVRLELAPPPDAAGEDAPLDAFARVSVIDSGIGVRPEEAAHLFERFYQGVDTGSRRTEGAGIGLSLSQGLVELHGGQMGVTSGSGQGASFWFTLPVGSAHLAPHEIDTGTVPGEKAGSAGGDEQGASTGKGPSPAEGESSGPLLLVAEDSDDMRAYLVEHLSTMGRVVQAADGRAALALARELRPNVIVSDVMMPEMDGIELCRAVRADPALRATCLVLVTAKTGPDERLEGLDVADEHLAKPFRMQELLARVRNLLRRAEPPEPARVDDARLAEAAEAADADSPSLPSADPECDRRFLEQLRAAVVARMADETFNVPRLARTMALSPRQLQRRCRELTGQGPLEFIRTVRMEEARDLILRGAFRTVSEVAAAVGTSPSYFTRLYSACHGHAPSDDLRI